MANYQPVASQLVLKVQVGIDEQGKPLLKGMTFRGLKSEASAEDVLAVAGALGSLLEVPVSESNKVDTDLLVS